MFKIVLAEIKDKIDELLGNTHIKKYEMNFVMKDGSRFNVLTLENKHQILADAQLLAKLLGIPVWNVSN